MTLREWPTSWVAIVALFLTGAVLFPPLAASPVWFTLVMFAAFIVAGNIDLRIQRRRRAKRRASD